MYDLYRNINIRNWCVKEYAQGITYIAIIVCRVDRARKMSREGRLQYESTTKLEYVLADILAV